MRILFLLILLLMGCEPPVAYEPLNPHDPNNPSGDPIPSAPTAFSLLEATHASILFSWQDNSSFEDQYIVEKRVSEDENFAPLAVLDANTTTFRDEGSSISLLPLQYRIVSLFGDNRNEKGDTLTLQFPVKTLGVSHPLNLPLAILHNGTIVVFRGEEGIRKFWFPEEDRVEDFPDGVGLCDGLGRGHVYACSEENDLWQVYDINVDGTLDLMVEIPFPTNLDGVIGPLGITNFRYYPEYGLILARRSFNSKLWVISAVTGQVLQSFDDIMDAVVNVDGLLVNVRNSQNIGVLETWGIQAGGFSLLDSKAIDTGLTLSSGKLSENGGTVFLQAFEEKRKFCFWNVATAALINCIETESDYLVGNNELKFSPNGEKVAIPQGNSTGEGEYGIYDVSSGTLQVRALDRGGALDGVISENFRFIASALHAEIRSQKTLKLFDLENNWMMVTAENDTP